MQRPLLFKMIIIFFLTVLIGIPLLMIQGTIEERAQFRAEAVASVAAATEREQTVTGPVLVIGYTDEYDDEQLVTEDGKSFKKTVVRSVARQFIAFPNQLAFGSTIKTDRRHRGIHQVLVYSGVHDISGDFALPTLAELPRANATSRLTPGAARVVIGISDVRGIRAIPMVDWDGRRVEFQQGTGLTSIPTGLQAMLGTVTLGQPAVVSFALTLGLNGIERQSFVPLGKNNTFKVKSNWPHPQFGGDFLPSPSDRTIGDSGFTANWQISSLSTMAQKQIMDREHAPDTTAPKAALDDFGVTFIEPVDVYSLAERAVKYGILFVVLTFASFFLFEMIKSLPIHPIQYMLVGLALVLFFLLLVSLSEHMKFIIAYLIASAACITLIGFYLSYVLHDWRRGLGFGLALTTLYGALYGLLISENNALVLGSLLLFAVLAGFMIATRKIDWYNLSAPKVLEEA